MRGLKRFFLWGIVGIFSISGCGQTGKNAGAAGSDNPAGGGSGAVSSKVYLSDATQAQVQSHIKECHGNSKKICVEICHRPPGNPDNDKTMILPLQATLAHLEHGGNHIDKDYLGACGAAEGGGEVEVPEDPPATDPGTDPGSDPGTDPVAEPDPGTTPEDPNPFVPVEIDPANLPPYCQAIYDLDKNCDGYADDSGIALL